MTTPTNQTPFAKAISGFLAHTQQTESKQCDVFIAMVDMHTVFTAEWTKRFLTTSGKDKTDIIGTTFRELELEGYDKLLEAAQVKLAKDASQDARVIKENAQKQVHALTVLLRTVTFALAAFRIKDITKLEVKKGGRIRYVIDGAWEGGHKGESLSTLVAYGKREAIEAGWVETPKAQVNHVSGQAVSTGAASPGTSSAETTEAVVRTDGASLPQAPNGTTALMTTCQALRIMLKSMRSYSEAEQKELIATERAVMKHMYGDDKGRVNLEDVFCAYEDSASTPVTLVKRSPKAVKQSA
jgi:hypothetical protein